MRSDEITSCNAVTSSHKTISYRHQTPPTPRQFRGGERRPHNLRQHHVARAEAGRVICGSVHRRWPGAMVWAGQLLLCFQAVYLGRKIQLCYLRWLGTVASVAVAAGRELDPLDTRYPFPTYRWDLHPGMGHFRGHPRAGAPHYGVVTAESVMHVAPIVPSPADPLDSVDPLFILASDMWEKF